MTAFTPAAKNKKQSTNTKKGKVVKKSKTTKTSKLEAIEMDDQ